MAYLALAERVSFSEMPMEDAAALLRAGLADRAASVREVVADRLVKAWLEDESVDGEPLMLLRTLNVQAYPGGQMKVVLLVATGVDRKRLAFGPAVEQPDACATAG
jgi:hypothetical protein